MFGQLRVWDTEDNNGVLIYVLLADRDVEIVADRGIHRHVGDDGVGGDLPPHGAVSASGRHVEASEAGVRADHGAARAALPGRRRRDPNELPDRPLVL